MRLKTWPLRSGITEMCLRSIVNGLIVVHTAFEAPTKVNRERHSVTSCAPGHVHLNNSLYVAPLPAISTSSSGSVNSADLPDTLQ